jgi:nitroreductase
MINVNERRSIRKYDPTQKIDQETMTKIIMEASRAPSSMNLQPWRFIVVETMKAKEALRPVLYGNKLQLDTCAAMICIFSDRQKFELAEKIYLQAFEAGLMPLDVKEKQLQSIANMIPSMTKEGIERTNLIDCGLVAMQLMLVAKSYGYDTCPIGGFKKSELASALGLDEARYDPVMIVSIGKKDEEGYHSTRLAIQDIAKWI